MNTFNICPSVLKSVLSIFWYHSSVFTNSVLLYILFNQIRKRVFYKNKGIKDTSKSFAHESCCSTNFLQPLVNYLSQIESIICLINEDFRWTKKMYHNSQPTLIYYNLSFTAFYSIVSLNRNLAIQIFKIKQYRPLCRKCLKATISQ